jgi:hypothetical protein
MFLSMVDAWPTDSDPPAPTQDQKTLKTALKNMFVAKKINASDISPVIKRNDWTSGTVYDYYKDTVDMFELDSEGNQVLNFYIKNRYDQVFKCLWNNNGAESLNEPFFEPGSYDTQGIYTGADGYKWKFIYTIDTGSKVKFMDSTWMPVLVGGNTPNPLASASGAGNIDTINILNGGSGYDPANAVVTVVITGDGTASNGDFYTTAAASAEVTDGVVTRIVVDPFNTGKDYTFANAAIVSTVGSGAVLEVPVSPIGGHGFDPVSEFGCNHVMFTTQFNGTESVDGVPMVPVSTPENPVDLHQVGLIVNPYVKTFDSAANTYVGQIATGDIYRTTTDLLLSSGFGHYASDEIVWQGKTFETAYFTGKVLSFDTSTQILKVLNTTGEPVNNQPINGKSSTTIRTLLSVDKPNYLIQSGYISYIENRTGVTRSYDGIEQIKLVLGY